MCVCFFFKYPRMFLLKLLWEGAIRGSSQSPPQGGLDVANPEGLPSPVQSGHILHPSSLTRWLAVENLFSFFYLQDASCPDSPPIPKSIHQPWASLVAQTVKNLPANAGDLGLEDLLEKGMATYSNICAWRIPWNVAHQAPLQLGHIPWGRRVGHNSEANTFTGWCFFLNSQLTLKSETPKRGFLVYVGTSRTPEPPCH